MIRHMVMFRRLAHVGQAAALEQSLVQRMRALPQEIGVIRGWKLSANVLDRPICWDYLLESAFDDLEALHAYLEHPAHVALIGDLKRYFEWAAVDYPEP